MCLDKCIPNRDLCKMNEQGENTGLWPTPDKINICQLFLRYFPLRLRYYFFSTCEKDIEAVLADS